MEKEQIQDLAIQFANEGLDAEHQVIYDAWILTSSDGEKNIFTEMIDLCADISMSGVGRSQIEISAKLKDQLIAKVDISTHDDGVKLIRQEDQEWINLPVKGGAKWLELSARKQDGFVMSMIEVQPGTGFPEHEHHGVEMAYILEGDLEADGLLLNAGDFFRADAGTHHGTHISPSGCRALIVTSSENYNHKTMKTLGAVQKAYRKVKGIFANS
ncbi:MAG: quercetin dioxygenase-like cupin family protein [Cryomorphaceae bacterium]|jgi:quercetin dioxygenase-like cupin family protein